MTLWSLPRKPEPEVMDDAGEVESYTSAAAAQHLNAIDDTFVEHVLGLLASQPGGSRAGCGLDIGTGPAQIPIKLLQKLAGFRMIGVDRSRNMLARARQDALAARVSERLILAVADGHTLPFPDAYFSLVICNSMLHHAREPVRLLREMARVAKPDAPLLLRDLRRPSRAALRFHLWRHGRHYQGLMRKLFEDSVRASYTMAELQEMIGQSRVSRLAPFRYRSAHIGIERAGMPETK